MIAKSMARHQAIVLDLGICKTQLLTAPSGRVAGGSSSRSERFLSLRTGAVQEKWKCDGQLIAVTACMANHPPPPQDSRSSAPLHVDLEGRNERSVVLPVMEKASPPDLAPKCLAGTSRQEACLLPASLSVSSHGLGAGET